MIRDLGYAEFAARVQTAAHRAHAPVGCLFEITPVCNLRCRFCYVSLDPYRGPYLDMAQTCRVLDIIADAGVLMLTLTGGEIFARRDFVEIYRHARRRGFLVTLYTNATLITAAQAAALAEEPPYAVEVSIYGADAEHYEAVTQIPGSFARFERGVDRLREAGLDPLMKHPVSTYTVDHLPAIRAWCEARRLRHKFAAELEGRHDGGGQPELYRLESRRVLEVKDALYTLRTGRPRELPMPECAAAPDADPNVLYRCSAGRSWFFVDALGRASHCVLDRQPAFPLLEMAWADLWARITEWVTQPLPADAPCSGCGLRSSCNNCPARSRIATGSPYLRDPYHCELTHVEHGLSVPDDVAGARRALGACVA